MVSAPLPVCVSYCGGRGVWRHVDAPQASFHLTEEVKLGKLGAVEAGETRERKHVRGKGHNNKIKLKKDSLSIVQPSYLGTCQAQNVSCFSEHFHIALAKDADLT